MGRRSDVQKLIPAIYEAASAPDGWPDLLGFLGRALDVGTTLTCLLPQGRMWDGEVWGDNIDPTSVESVMQPGWVDRSAIVHQLTMLPLQRSADLRIAGLDTLEADPGAQRLLLPQGLTQGRFAPILREAGMISGVAFLNEGKRGPLTAPAVARIEALLAPLGHAMRISLRQRRLLSELHMLRAALGELVVGVITLSGGLTIRHANAEAERILSARDGIARRQGRLTFAEPGHASALQREISLLSVHHDGAPAGCLFARRPSGAPAYTLVVAPAGTARHAGMNSGAATLFVTDPVGPDALPMPAILAEAFGLSATEAEVTRLVVMGRGMGFVADSLGISLNTARTHLKAVYAKTGVNHQAALARTIAHRFPPVRGLSGPTGAHPVADGRASGVHFDNGRMPPADG